MLLRWPAFLFLICVARVCAVFPFSVFEPLNRSVEIKPIEEIVNGQTPMLVNGVLYKTFKKYYCSLWNKADNLRTRTLVHGHEGWTFPRQDVNLTLAYPSDDLDTKDYVITGYHIILFMDGSESTAVISKGGLLEDYIHFTFLCTGITTLSYRFWLYGSERSRLPFSEPVNMC